MYISVIPDNIILLLGQFTLSRSAQALRNLFTYIFNAKYARALGDKITRQRYTLPHSYVVYALENYYGVRGRMEKPYPRTLSAGRAV